MKMRNDGGVSLAVLDLCILTEIRLATFDTDHSVTDIRQTINRCFNPEASRFCSSVSLHSSP